MLKRKERERMVLEILRSSVKRLALYIFQKEINRLLILPVVNSYLYFLGIMYSYMFLLDYIQTKT